MPSHVSTAGHSPPVREDDDLAEELVSISAPPQRRSARWQARPTAALLSLQRAKRLVPCPTAENAHEHLTAPRHACPGDAELGHQRNRLQGRVSHPQCQDRLQLQPAPRISLLHHVSTRWPICDLGRTAASAMDGLRRAADPASFVSPGVFPSQGARDTFSIARQSAWQRARAHARQVRCHSCLPANTHLPRSTPWVTTSSLALEGECNRSDATGAVVTALAL